MGFCIKQLRSKLEEILTTLAPSPRTALSAKSGTGSHEGLPMTFPKCSHISANLTGFGAVPFITPDGIFKSNKLSISHLICQKVSYTYDVRG